MKKQAVLTALLSVLLLIAFGCPAGAEEAAPAAAAQEDEYIPRRVWQGEVNPDIVKYERTVGDVEYEARYSEGTLNTLEVELETDGLEYEVLYNAGGTILYAEYESGTGEILYDGAAWRDASGKEVSGPDLAFMKEYFDNFGQEAILYPQNTMGLVGLPLRELDPGLTDKWYHIVPVDLTREGTFTYQTAVSNVFLAGYATVTILDGKVTVDYVIPHGAFDVKSQCLAWFTDLEEITTAFLENPESGFRYGKPVDIREELNGQDTALLFMCNRVSYQVPLYENVIPARFYTTGLKMDAYRQQLQELLDAME